MKKLFLTFLISITFICGFAQTPVNALLIKSGLKKNMIVYKGDTLKFGWLSDRNFSVSTAGGRLMNFNIVDSSATIYNKLILSSPNDTMLSVRGNAYFSGNIDWSYGMALRYNSSSMNFGHSIASPLGSGNYGIGYLVLSNLASNGSYNTALGYYSLNKVTSGDYNVGVGRMSGYNITTANDNITIGHEAGGGLNSQSNNVAIGTWTLRSGDYSGSVAIGHRCLQAGGGGSNVGIGYTTFLNLGNTSVENTAIGHVAFQIGTAGSYNTGVGAWNLYYAGQSGNAADRNNAIGWRAGFNVRSGDDNTYIGYSAGYSNQTGSSSISIGNYSGYYDTRSNFLYINSLSRGSLLNDTTMSIIYGRQSSDISSQDLRINANTFIGGFGAHPPVLSIYGTSNTSVFNGTVTADIMNGGVASNLWTTSGNANTDPSVNFIGTTDAGRLVFRVNGVYSGTIDSTLNYVNRGGATHFGYRSGQYDEVWGNSFFGYFAGSENISGIQNVAFGAFALASNIIGEYNTAVGQNSMRYTTGGWNTAVGQASLQNNIDGEFNTVVGEDSYQKGATGSYNSGLGAATLNNCYGNYNTTLGNHSGNNLTSGSYNLFVGNYSGYYGNWSYKGFIDVIDRGDSASQLTSSPIVIDFNADSSLQVVTFNAKVIAAKSVQVGSDSDAASASNVGAIRYRSDANNSYCEMVMQTGVSTYAWVVIKQNTW